MFRIKPQTAIRIAPAGDMLCRTPPGEFVPLDLFGDTQDVDGATWHAARVWVRGDRVAGEALPSLNKRVPHYTQLGIGRRNACGPAGVAGVVDYTTGVLQDVAALSRIVDPDQNGTTAQDLVRAGAARGVALSVIASPSPFLAYQVPAIVLHEYRWSREMVSYQTFFGTHWSTLVGYTADTVILNDPLGPGHWGEYRHFPLGQWLDVCHVPYGGVYFAVVLAEHAHLFATTRGVFDSPRSQSPETDAADGAPGPDIQEELS